MKNILVPIDFSPNAEKAMHFAIRMVQGNKDATLYFLNVINTPLMTGYSKDEYDKRIEELLQENIGKIQKHVLAIYKQMLVSENEIREEALVRYGDFLEEVNNAVQEKAIDLVVMGTHGASGIKKVLFGSNTADVMEKVSCAVLAVPDEYGNAPVTRIAYATDFQNVEDGLAEIVDFAKFFHASIELFHVHIPERAKTDPTTFDRNGFLREISKKFNYEHFTLAFIKLIGDQDDLTDGIESYVAQKRPSVIAMATYERMWYESIFKPSKTKAMIFQTTTPLLVVKKK